MDFYQQLLAIAGEDQVKCKEPMSKHTTFRVGGPADYFVIPKTEEQAGKIRKVCEENQVPCFILGNGSNLLVGDQGYRGVILHLGDRFTGVQADGTWLIAGAGVRLSRLAAEACEKELTGLEFASGIPGTLGGAVVMNAGAYGSEMKNVIRSARVMDRSGNILELSRDQLELGYRTSCILKNHYLVLEAVIELAKGRKEEIRSESERLNRMRKEKQPLEYPSAGSTFKRPEGYFAGKLIQDAGLAGMRVGGAAVSKKHCGFVINEKEATAADILTLCHRIQEKVYQQFGVNLEMEVKRLGVF